MKKETYVKMTEKIKSSAALYGLVLWSDRILTKISYVAYPLLIVFLALKKEPELSRALMVPAISFVLISIFRYVYCASRPYEVFDTAPAINKNTKGKSFPSRHVFSAFIIAFTFFYFTPAIGIILFALSTYMAVIRVVGGVHFTKDVVAGAVVALICGGIGFYII